MSSFHKYFCPCQLLLGTKVAQNWSLLLISHMRKQMMIMYVVDFSMSIMYGSQ